MPVPFSLLPLSAATHPFMDKVESTYNRSFPEEERRSFAQVCQLLDNHPAFHLLVILRGDAYIGFLSFWEFGFFRYVEHFAVDETIRGGGYGRLALEAFMGQSDLPVVLEVELPENEMAQRRIRFYERLGFTLDTQSYWQPSYHTPDHFALELRLMSWGNIQLASSFEEVKRLIYREVYGVHLIPRL